MKIIDYKELVKELESGKRKDLWINGFRLFWNKLKVNYYAPYETDRDTEGYNLCFYSDNAITAEIQHIDDHCKISVVDDSVTGCLLLVYIADTFIHEPNGDD